MPEGLDELYVAGGPRLQKESWKDVGVNPQLSSEQRAAVNALLQEYSDILTDLPGATTLVEHDVHLTDEVPIRQRPYRIPHAMMEIVRSQMEKMGVIEESQSAWSL